MAEPKRIQRRRTKGWRMPPGAVYVGRPASWGNPYVVGRSVWVLESGSGGPVWVRDRQHAVDLYRAALAAYPPWVEKIRRDLRGKDLCCWCPLDRPCHADVLLEVANGTST